MPSALAGLGVLAAAILGGYVLARRRLLVIDVVGDSMSPTYRAGDRLLVHRTRRFRTGDVVIAHHQDGGRRDAGTELLATTWLVKRLAALPGDPVPTCVIPVVGADAARVPAGMAVLLGEHSGSADSRIWGFIPLEDLTGVVITRLDSGSNAAQETRRARTP